jgi:hypothetical protein
MVMLTCCQHAAHVLMLLMLLLLISYPAAGLLLAYC